MTADGNRAAEKIGKNNFRAVLMARNAEHLSAYEKEFKDKEIEVYTKVAGITGRGLLETLHIGNCETSS